MVRKVLVLRLLVFCSEKDGNYALQMGRSGLAGIDVEKSSSHQQSQTEIASDNPCYRHLSGNAPVAEQCVNRALLNLQSEKTNYTCRIDCQGRTVGGKRNARRCVRRGAFQFRNIRSKHQHSLSYIEYSDALQGNTWGITRRSKHLNSRETVSIARGSGKKCVGSFESRSESLPTSQGYDI